MKLPSKNPLLGKWRKKTDVVETPEVVAPVNVTSTAEAELQALAMEAKKGMSEPEQRAVDAVVGSLLLGIVRDPNFRRIGAGAALGISLLGMANGTAADIAYLNHNDAELEIKALKRLARELGDDFHVVVPTPENLERLFDRAEKGEIDLATVIFSGHSTGTSVWGYDANDEHLETTIEQMQEMKTRYPAAFSQVKRLYFLACYVGTKGNTTLWREVFPNARVLVGFAGSGPSKEKPASWMVVSAIERDARRIGDRHLTPREKLATLKRWAKKPGPKNTKIGMSIDDVHYQHARYTSEDTIMENVYDMEMEIFDRYFNGREGYEMVPSDHSTSTLRAYYETLQQALGDLEPGSSESEGVLQKIPVTLRLMYFDHVRANIQAEYADRFAAVNKEFEDVGLEFRVPDVSKLNRKEVSELVTAFYANTPVATANFEGRFPDTYKTLVGYLEKRDIDLNSVVMRSNGSLAEAFAALAHSIPSDEEVASADQFVQQFSTYESMRPKAAAREQHKQALQMIEAARESLPAETQSQLRDRGFPSKQQLAALDGAALRKYAFDFPIYQDNEMPAEISFGIDGARTWLGEEGGDPTLDLMTGLVTGSQEAVIILQAMGAGHEHWGIHGYAMEHGRNKLGDLVKDFEEARANLHYAHTPPQKVADAFEKVTLLVEGWKDSDSKAMKEVATILTAGLQDLDPDIITNEHIRLPQE